jgi:hypothetical protein
LYVAAKSGYSEVVLHLITKCSNNQVHTTDQYTAFIMACCYGHTNIAKLLLFNDANIDETNQAGETGLYLAALHGHTETVKYLINYGADVNTLTHDGLSIIKAASCHNNVKLINFLLKHGVEDHMPRNATPINFYSTSITPLFCQSKLPQPIAVMSLFDNTTNLNCFQLVCFIFALPFSYEAKDSKKSNSSEFFRYYNICENNTTHIPLMRISSSEDFSSNRIEIIQGAPTLNIVTTHHQFGFISQFYQETHPTKEILTHVQIEQFENFRPSHPYKKIGKNIQKKYPFLYSSTFNEEVLSPKTLRNRDCKQFMVPLADILATFEGDVFLTVNPLLDNAFIFGDNLHIRTMTWLIPNITIVLSKCQYIELDGSFQASYPYVYTVHQAIIQNEAIPLGFTLAPSESMEMFKEFYDAITSAYPHFDLHLKIPILTDQGTGLIAFAKSFNLEHYLCYKHLLFKFIQNSPLYFLVRRILNSTTPENLQKITNTIQLTAALIFEKSTAHKAAFEYIFQWSYDRQMKLWTQKPTEFSTQML